jgi:uncharacterized membrane protein
LGKIAAFGGTLILLSVVLIALGVYMAQRVLTDYVNDYEQQNENTPQWGPCGTSRTAGVPDPVRCSTMQTYQSIGNMGWVLLFIGVGVATMGLVLETFQKPAAVSPQTAYYQQPPPPPGY